MIVVESVDRVLLADPARHRAGHFRVKLCFSRSLAGLCNLQLCAAKSELLCCALYFCIRAVRRAHRRPQVQAAAAAGRYCGNCAEGQPNTRPGDTTQERGHFSKCARLVPVCAPLGGGPSSCCWLTDRLAGWPILLF